MKSFEIRVREKFLEIEKKIKNIPIPEVDTLTFDEIYPVGAIYLSATNVSPATLFGGTWKRIAQGRTLFGADDTDYVAGNTIEAGLPNITGSFQLRHPSGNYTGVYENTDGALTGIPNGGDQKWTYGYSGTSASKNIDKVEFNAANSDSIYGNSSTVQPPALVVYIWQRTA